MSFNIGNDVGGITLGGTNIKFINGRIIIDSDVPGNIKQYNAGRWNSLNIPAKDKMTRIRITAEVEDDEAKAVLEGFRDDGTYSYADGVQSFSNVVVVGLSFSHVWDANSGFQHWLVNLVLEEFDQ